MTLGNYGRGPYRVTVRNRDRDDTQHTRFRDLGEAVDWYLRQVAAAEPGDDVSASRAIEEAARERTQTHARG